MGGSDTSDDEGFPWKQTGVLAICRLAEPVAFCSITAYAFIMVQDIKGEKDASFYAGLLVSVFAAAEACTAWLWGSLSDKYGRKPIILVALAGTALSSLIFGFAKNYWVALIARVVGGALNGNVAVMQTMVAEMVTRPEHEPRAYALQPFMWSVGAIAGSALGGFTAQPAKYYPGVFSEDGIFGQFPYLLPNLIAVGVILIAMVQGALFLEETNEALVAAREEQKAQKSNGNGPMHQANEVTPLIAEHMGIGHASGRRGSARRSSVLSRSSAMTHGSHYVAVGAGLPIDPAFDLRRSSAASIGSLALFKKAIQQHQLTSDAAVMDDADDDTDDEAPSVPEKAFTNQVILWIIGLWLLCYHQMAFSSILPVFLLDDQQQPSQHLDLQGGLGKTLPQVGTVLAVNSVISLVIQGFIFPPLVSKLGLWWSVMLFSALSPVVYFLMPLTTLLPDPQAGVYVVMAMQSFTANMAYPVVLILLKDACPSLSVLGRVNGIAMSGCSGARTIAPPIVGAVYSASGSAASWWSAGVVAIVAFLELLFISRPKHNTEEIIERAAISTDEI